MSSNLWNKKKYTAPINCIVDRTIKEYDISKANISVLLDAGFLTYDQYKFLYNVPKLQRQINIGMMITQNQNINEIIDKCIIDAKRIFFESNNIQDNEVLEIDNDSIFLLTDRVIKYQQISEHVMFRLAGISTSFYSINDIRYFYLGDRINNTEILNPKGLGDKGIALHQNFMLDFLKELFYTAQFDGIQRALTLLSVFYNKYINMELDLGYYRTLNPSSMFRLFIRDMYSTFGVDYIYDPRFVKFMDISYNAKILREFNKILTTKAFNKQ